MANEVEICNVALSRVGRYSIQSLDESSKDALACKLHYASTRDAVLRAHEWNFSTKRQILALLTDTYSGWDYAYQYPTDCLVARKIYNPAGDDGIPFEIAASASLDSKVLLTDQEEAVLIYTARVTNPNMFDSVFIDALSYRLASELAIPLKGDPNIQQALARTYLSFIGEAEQVDSTEQYVTPTDDSDLSEARI